MPGPSFYQRRVPRFRPSNGGGASVGRLIFTGSASSTLDNHYVVGSSVGAQSTAVRRALLRRANNTAEGKPCGQCQGSGGNIPINKLGLKILQTGDWDNLSNADQTANFNNLLTTVSNNNQLWISNFDTATLTSLQSQVFNIYLTLSENLTWLDYAATQSGTQVNLFLIPIGQTNINYTTLQSYFPNTIFESSTSGNSIVFLIYFGTKVRSVFPGMYDHNGFSNGQGTPVVGASATLPPTSGSGVGLYVLKTNSPTLFANRSYLRWPGSTITLQNQYYVDTPASVGNTSVRDLISNNSALLPLPVLTYTEIISKASTTNVMGVNDLLAFLNNAISFINNYIQVYNSTEDFWVPLFTLEQGQSIPSAVWDTIWPTAFVSAIDSTKDQIAVLVIENGSIVTNTSGSPIAIIIQFVSPTYDLSTQNVLLKH